MVDERFFRRSAVKTLEQLCEKPDIAALLLNKSSFLEEALKQEITTINTLKDAEPSDISFFDNVKYKNDFISTHSGFCIVRPKYEEIAPKGVGLLLSDDPYRLYAIVATHLYEDLNYIRSTKDNYYQDDFGAFIHKEAILEENVQTSFGVVIEAGANIGSGTIIGAGTSIGRGVMIGRSCVIGANVTISHSFLGDRVHIFPNSSIGQAGFGYALGKTHFPVPQLGRVILQDDVHIGAGVTIDRGAIKDTFIGEGSRIDNLTQIGHNVIMGRYCVMAGGCSVAGSVTFGDYVISGGHTGYAGHLHIGAGARIAGGAGISRNVPAGDTWAGNLAKPMKQYFREMATLEKISRYKSKGE